MVQIWHKLGLIILVVSTFVYAEEEGESYPPFEVGDRCPRTGDGVIRYDIDPFFYEGRQVTDINGFTLRMTGDLGYTDLSFVFLLTVPSVPYVVNQMCSCVDLTEENRTVRFRMYKPIYAIDGGKHMHIQPDVNNPFYSTKGFKYPPHHYHYISFDLDDLNGDDTFVIPYKHVFAGVNVEKTDMDISFYMNEWKQELIEEDEKKWVDILHQMMRPTYVHGYAGANEINIPYNGPFSSSIAFSGKPLNPQDRSKWSKYMKNSWTCDPALYGDGKECNCGCGLPDPDCDMEGANRTCLKGDVPGICFDGKCLTVELAEWNKCPLESFGDGKFCDCGCSDNQKLVDPDCQLPGMVRKCHGIRSSCIAELSQGFFSQYYDATYSCTPDEWRCETKRYGDGYCDCGTCSDSVIDPDCLFPNPNTSCGGMYCVNYTCDYPQAWTCPPEYYNDHQYCDCDCGVYDPDCFLRNATLRGCPEDGNVYTCVRPEGTMDAVCRVAECGNGITEPTAGEECDGGEGCENCKCMKGYVAPSYAVTFCVTVCGDGIVAGDEECDSSPFCDPKGCVCQLDHELNPEIGLCSGCGNGVLEEGEECDSGEGCSNVTCKCLSGYRATNNTYCLNTNVGTIVGASLGSVLGAFLICALIFILLYFLLVHRKKNADSVELSSMDSNALTADSFIGVLAADDSVWNVSPTVLDFGFTRGQLAPIGVSQNAKVVLTNSSAYKMTYQVIIPQSNKYALRASSVNGSVLPNGTVAIDFDLTLFCTTKVRTAVTFGVEYEKEKHKQVRERREMKVRVEGQVSTHIDIDELQFEAPIGEGQCSCGVVNRGKWREHDVAIKVLPYVNDRIVSDFLHEVDVMESLQSDYLVKFYGGAMSSDRMCLVTQLMHNGNLSQFLTTYQLSPYMKVRIAHDIACGMAFLHANHLIHRNLKPTNVLIASHNVRDKVLCKISDFGASRFISDEQAAATMTNLTVTPLYTAPEMMIENGKYSMASDVFSFGIILAEIWNEFLPYSEKGFDSPFALSRYIIEGNRPGLRSDCPPSYMSLAQACWVTEPSSRPTFAQIVAVLESKDFEFPAVEPFLLPKQQQQAF